MDIKGFLETVCKEIKYKPARSGIEEELKLHIQDIKEDYIKNGMQETEAEEKAVSQMGNAEEIGKKLNKIHKPKLDWKLLILIAILVGFGIAISILKQQTTHISYLGNTIIYILISMVLGTIVYFFDYRKLKSCSNIIYLIASILMIMPLIPGIGFTINGRYCIRFLSCSFFPHTIAVPLYIISFIGYITNYNKENTIKITTTKHEIATNKGILKILAFSILSLILTINTSIVNAMILGVIYLIIITAKIIKSREKRLKKLGIIYGIIGIFALVIISVIIINPYAYRLDRITYSFKPQIDPQGGGYTGMLQKEVLENAKIIGEAETEIISSDEFIISKESNYTFIYLIGKMGIILSGILVLTIILTSIKLILNAKVIKDQYGKFLIIGLSALYIFQSIASVLMNINLGIKTDIDLPFVTYGGTYLIINTISIAIILSIYRRKNINVYDEKFEEQYH